MHSGSSDIEIYFDDGHSCVRVLRITWKLHCIRSYSLAFLIYFYMGEMPQLSEPPEKWRNNCCT